MTSRRRRPGLAPRAHRRCEAGADRRGDARHLRVLRDARAHHPGADPVARLRVRRGRGRLARRGARGPLRAGGDRWPAPTLAGLRALPHLDVAQPRDARLHRLAARVERGARGAGRRGRVLRPRPLQHVHLDPDGARVPRPDRSGDGSCRARALRLLDALGGRPRHLRSRRRDRALPDVRARGRGDAARPARQGARVRASATAPFLDAVAQRAPWLPMRSATTARCTTAGSSRGTSATGTCSTRWRRYCSSTAPARRPSCGSTTRTSATRRPPRWACAARSTSATSAGRLSATTRTWSASAPTTARSPPRTSGTGRWRS